MAVTVAVLGASVGLGVGVLHWPLGVVLVAGLMARAVVPVVWADAWAWSDAHL